MPDRTPTAIITGGGRGIGRATAVMLASRGFACVIVGRTKDQIEAAAAECGNALPIVADVSTVPDCDRIVKESLQWRGRLDVLINNAGYAPVLTLEQTTPAEFHRVIDTNLTSAYLLCRAVWPTFVQQRGGVIVNVSSLAATDPLPGFMAYGAAKAGLNTLGLALAREGAQHGIRVHTVAPGATETGMFRAIADEKSWPRDRTLAPEDVARVITACVEGTLANTSGQVIPVRRRP